MIYYVLGMMFLIVAFVLGVWAGNYSGRSKERELCSRHVEWFLRCLEQAQENGCTNSTDLTLAQESIKYLGDKVFNEGQYSPALKFFQLSTLDEACKRFRNKRVAWLAEEIKSGRGGMRCLSELLELKGNITSELEGLAKKNSLRGELHELIQSNQFNRRETLRLIAGFIRKQILPDEIKREASDVIKKIVDKMRNDHSADSEAIEIVRDVVNLE